MHVDCSLLIPRLRRVASPWLIWLAVMFVAPSAVADEPQTLRERLTEREDENRTPDPFTTEIFGNPLTLEGQYELSTDLSEQITQGDPPDGETRTLLTNQLEVEAFYAVGERFAVFLQAAGTWQEDVVASTQQGLSDVFVERGEMWLRDGQFLGLPVELEVGRLDFEDDRLWWWDEGLDAIRLSYETERFEVMLSAARELLEARTGAGGIDPEQKKVLRLIGEVSWDWAEEQSLQLFALHHDDASRTESVGARVRRTHEDDSDAHLTWFGLRATGAGERADYALGYWLDSGFVTGRERILEFTDASQEIVQVTAQRRRSVRGFGVDAGSTLMFPAPCEPRLSAGFAFGSGDSDTDGGTDRSYRQSGLHGNAAGLGGVQRFSGYGNLLDPELSNLFVSTLGLGISILESSSIDLVHHGYWQARAATELRESRLEAALNGRNKAIGHEIDLIVAIEEWDILQIEAGVSTFRAGKAWGRNSGDWGFGAQVKLRFAF